MKFIKILECDFWQNYTTIFEKLKPVKFDGTQDFEISAEIKTISPRGTLFVKAFPANWGAKWEDGGYSKLSLHTTDFILLNIFHLLIFSFLYTTL